MTKTHPVQYCLRSTLPVAVAMALVSPAALAERSLMLEEVRVTAAKRESSLQETPIAVTALAGTAVDDVRIDNVLDLQSLAPSLQVSTYNAGARVFVRGIGLVSFAPGAEPSVAYHVDGAVISRPQAQVATYYDIERIEVLRGPQGSLYGRNATGGSINVLTRRPEQDFGGSLGVGVGNFDLLEYQGMVTGGLGDSGFAGRVAFKVSERDGYGENLFNGVDVDDNDSKSVRASVSYDGSDSFGAFLSYSHHEEDDANYVQHGFGPGNPDFQPAEVAQGGTLARDPRDFNTELVPLNDKEVDSVTLELTWQVADNISIKSLSNWLELDGFTVTDLGATEVQFLGGTATQQSEQFSQELQLNIDGEHHETMFGLYYFEEDYLSDVIVDGPPVFTDVLMRPFIRFFGEMDSESMAAFWNTNWHFNPEWSLRVGLRYSKDEKEDTGVETLPPGDTILARDDDWDAWTPSATLQYSPMDGRMFYATVSRGYKTGVINTGNSGDPVDPEFIWNYELGMKSQWWDDRLQVNAAVFYAEIEDLQVQRPQSGTLVTLNAAEATTQGFEVETVALLSEGLTVSLNLAYVDAQFDEFLTSNTTTDPDTEIDLKGNPLPNSPEWQADLALEYGWEMPHGWAGSARLQGVYTDERWYNEFQEEIAYQDDTFTVNANLALESGDGHWRLNLWGRNLTDEDIITHVNVSSRTLGHLRLGNLYAPRIYGATVSYAF